MEITTAEPTDIDSVTTLHVTAIAPARLDAVRAAGHDEQGHPLTPFPADGWEPLRCCLRFPDPGEPILLIGYSPFATTSPWAETGPVFVHAARCAGYSSPERLPAGMDVGPKILRTYLADGTLDYDHITYVAPGEELDGPVRALLAEPEVATVHVRASLQQCFTYAVTSAGA